MKTTTIQMIVGVIILLFSPFAGFLAMKITNEIVGMSFGWVLGMLGFFIALNGHFYHDFRNK